MTIQPKGAVITTTYRPTQRKSYKTFDVMPLAAQALGSRELDIMKGPRAEIRKQEAEWAEWASHTIVSTTTASWDEGLRR